MLTSKRLLLKLSFKATFGRILARQMARNDKARTQVRLRSSIVAIATGSSSSRLELEAEARLVGWPHVDSFRAARDPLLLFELLVDLLGTAGPGKEHLAPRRILVGK